MAEFIAARLSGSLGGCADGTPASQRGKQQGRNGKSQVEQGEAGVMVSLPGRQGGTIDREIGARNVNLRASEEAVDLKVSAVTLVFHRTRFILLCSPLACLLFDYFFFSSKNNKAGLSEVQRLELAMKDMLASFKQKVCWQQRKRVTALFYADAYKSLSACFFTQDWTHTGSGGE